MNVRWYGQSAFLLEADGERVFIDPFGDMSALSGSHGIRWDYPAIEGVEADLLLVTHEHRDHNAVEAVGGDPAIIRSTAGRLGSPFGEVVAIASEHDRAAGTERGPNTLFALDFGGLRVAHLGDLGQAALRDEQLAALGSVDLLFVPAGGGPVLDAQAARLVIEQVAPRWAVPMHYRTPAIGFLETADELLDAYGDAVVRLDGPSFDTGDLPADGGPQVVVPAAPGA
ncbi:MAG TPA: MBL fold metallo-hydrolase [Solirubrobacteraceae bacterium]|nr:MBL fold metallo-hydrolase [Solirubrobacteraceae bacterium]